MKFETIVEEFLEEFVQIKTSDVNVENLVTI